MQLDAQHRVPFVPMSPDQNPSDWNYGSVQSIGGSFIIPGEAGRDDTMLVRAQTEFTFVTANEMNAFLCLVLHLRV